MTGRYQQRVGIPGVVVADPRRAVHLDGLQSQEVTFPEVLRDAGYQTAIFGKWHLGYDKKYNPVHHGFGEFRGYVSGNVDFFSHIDQAGNFDWWKDDEHFEEPGYTTHLITKHALRFIDENKERPFFLYLPHEAPHYPYQGPHDRAERTIGGKFNTQGARKDVREAYREMVQEMDTGVGEIVARLKKLGLSEKTLVVFCSDNGANKYGSNRPLRGSKGSNWEGGHRVPCIAYWPSHIKAGTQTDQMAISFDWMPTFMALAGVKSASGRTLDGIDLSNILSGAESTRRQLFWNGRAMRDGNWKLVVGGKGSKGVELFNLAKDLGELEDVSKQHPDRVKQMQAALAAWREDVAKDATEQPSAKVAGKIVKLHPRFQCCSSTRWSNLRNDASQSGDT